jgi:hypothetical protein
VQAERVPAVPECLEEGVARVGGGGECGPVAGDLEERGEGGECRGDGGRRDGGGAVLVDEEGGEAVGIAREAEADGVGVEGGGERPVDAAGEQRQPVLEAGAQRGEAAGCGVGVFVRELPCTEGDAGGPRGERGGGREVRVEAEGGDVDGELGGLLGDAREQRGAGDAVEGGWELAMHDAE